MSKITGEQVKQAVLKAGIDRIPHHDCSICREEVFYSVIDDLLFFNSGCRCSWSPSEHRDWQNAADWINMQTNDEARECIKKRFGITPTIKEGEDE